MDGIIVLVLFQPHDGRGARTGRRIARTCQIQMRPVMMTCVAACVGLLPAAISTGIGSQVQKPLALVVVGGMLLAPHLYPAGAAGPDRDLFPRHRGLPEAAEA